MKLTSRKFVRTRRAVVVLTIVGLIAVIGLLFTNKSDTTAAVPPVTITEFTGGLNQGSIPGDIVAAPDGEVWFTDAGRTPAIGRITPDGTITEFSKGLSPGSLPSDIVLGLNGDVWFTEVGRTQMIGRITPSGHITEFAGGLNQGSIPGDIVAGPDGDVWFTDVGRTPAIGRITPSGQITEFSKGLKPGSILGERPGSRPGEFVSGVCDIVLGSDGDLWFTDRGRTPAIGRITPDGTITEFSMGPNPGLNPGAKPIERIVSGPDGDLWFTDGILTHTGAIARITPNGIITQLTNPDHRPGELISSVFGIVSDQTGDVWFTYLGSGSTTAVGRIAPSGMVTTFTKGLKIGSLPTDIISGSKGTLWFVDHGRTSAIGRISTG